MKTVEGAIVLILLIVGYWAPTMVAGIRDRNVGPVVVVNLFFGWTVIGWVIALAMALGDRKQVAV